jgi:hypothetical protein
VVTTNNTNLNAAIRFKYLVYETIGISEPMLSLLNSLDGKKWAMSGGVVNTANHYLDYTGANNLNWFTLAPYNTSLPIMLSGFTATCQSAAVLLQWQTQQEINSDYIEVQAGTDGSTWTALGQLKARGNIFTTQQYTFTDNTGNGRKYYRLKLVDLDGSFRYSPVYKVGCDIKDFSVTTFPNPVTINADIIFNGLQKKQVRIELLNAAGQLVYSEYIGAVGNYKRHSIAMTGFATGTYYLRTRAEGDYIKTIAIQKQ